MEIIADYREKPSGLLDLLKKTDFYMRVKKVPYGDYIVNDSVTIERKTSLDFLLSLIDGQLYKQISDLKKYSTYPVLLIEGNPYQADINFDHAAIQGALISVQATWYIPILFSNSKEESANILVAIGKQSEKNLDVVSLRSEDRPKNLQPKQLYILQGLPGVGPTLAKRLIENFSSVSKIMRASIDELSKIEGLGKVSARKIREVLDTESL
ncbi:ERCC4 domain-containing protein [Thermodesulfobacteriota bacterium]